MRHQRSTPGGRRMDRLAFDTLDVIHARERATPRALAAAWLVASMVVVAFFALALATPALLHGPRIADASIWTAQTTGLLQDQR